MPGRVAVVVPRFGPAVVGGAEALCAEIATGLSGRGWEVEVLTTTAVNHYSWADDLDEGETHESGLTVRRFRTVPHPGAAGRDAQLDIEREVLPSLDEQVAWLSWRFSVPGLYEHLLVHGGGYRAVLFAPYLFWTTTVCLPLVADRAVAMPCLHDEFYARLDVIRPALESPARVWFLSEPEHALAHRLCALPRHHTVTGAGMAVPDRYDPARFVARHGLRRPFLLYAGRRETGKGWEWLLDAFVAAGDLGVDLVSIGVGDVKVPEEAAGRVHDLGSLPDGERDDAMAAALAYVQPSLMESFSRTVMEAWLAGTPVLARSGGAVVAWHVERSGGGLVFDGPDGLADALRALGVDGTAETMAASGRRYVLDHYTWPVVLDAMESDLEGMPA